PSTRESANLLSGREEIAVDVDENEAVALVLRQSEMSLHHAKIVHGSPPNRSDGRRFGLAIRYVAPHVRTRYDWTSALLVRGRNKQSCFALDSLETLVMYSEIDAFPDCNLMKVRWH